MTLLFVPHATWRRTRVAGELAMRSASHRTFDAETVILRTYRDSDHTDVRRLYVEGLLMGQPIPHDDAGDLDTIPQTYLSDPRKHFWVAEAQGQTARFLKIYQEYKKAPDVTRRRIFLETMESVLGGTDKIILDNRGGPGVVPYLPLGELKSSGGASQPQRGGQ